MTHAPATMDLNSKTVDPKKIWRLTYNARMNPPSRITATPRRYFPAPMERLKKTAILPRLPFRLDNADRDRDQAPPVSAFRQAFLEKKIFRSLRSLNRYDTKPMHLTVATVDTEGRLAGV